MEVVGAGDGREGCMKPPPGVSVEAIVLVAVKIGAYSRDDMGI